LVNSSTSCCLSKAEQEAGSQVAAYSRPNEVGDIQRGGA
jgi:hypothetical protein